MKTLIVLVFFVFAASAEIAADGTDENGYEKRYLVFPGSDAGTDEVAEWPTGWASPFNVFFGPKPYVIGWIGEGGSFIPDNSVIGGGIDDEKVQNQDKDPEENRR